MTKNTAYIKVLARTNPTNYGRKNKGGETSQRITEHAEVLKITIKNLQGYSSAKAYIEAIAPSPGDPNTIIKDKIAVLAAI